MTEKEKAAAGLLYDANYDKELISERNKARQILLEYNRLNPSDYAMRKELIKRLLGTIGERFCIEQPFYCDYGYNIHIGENFFSNVNCVILDGAKVSIGDNVFLAPNVGIYTAGHPLDVPQRNIGLEYAFPVNIGSNVWVGAGTSILPGATIGNNTVLGAGSVVVKSIPSNVLAAGNPCKVIREITESDKEKYEK
ncbi:sugar O-acetyltransferase [Clostridium sp. KNHs216]|uniref:sugar O-acetyltransferase n=1 Tax=Clostridium sp. KNHs216 TaxID=1550235 RepID=UPI001153146A|nr:sugar O-acetyltransferase [Clostridium sp. KNHs216]TQI66997.1 galactoside O-acetyltransferase [Clostridium sp. KNHs216]